MLHPSYLHLFCIIISILHALSAAAASTLRAPALYVFGDSLFDSGNNNHLLTLAKVNYEPYGVDFAEGPTGRFTNGRTVADFIAEYLGIPYPPPIMGFSEPNWNTSFNYASGACGILDETGSHLGKCLNFGEQIDQFEKTVEEVIKKLYMNLRDASFLLSKSIFIFSVGNNDYINNYLDVKYDTSLFYTPEQFSQLLIHHLSQKLQRLYKLGARKFVFFELGPIGCMPSQAKTTKHNGLCNEKTNHIISLFNKGLQPLFSNFSSTLPGSHFVLGQTYGLGYDAIIHPSKYGLSNNKDSCCRAWLNNTLSCIPKLQPCINHNKHFFWDSYHPTEGACSLIASQCIRGSSVCVPLNIHQLVKI
ncbi:hypothetical protein V2J09_013342 [Rumex salicifolius]